MKKNAFGIVLWLFLIAIIFVIPLAPISSKTEIPAPPVATAIDQVLVFFGYTHCNSVCPMVLSQLNQVVREAASEQGRPQVLFVNLSKGDSPDLSSQYARSFNEAFIGIQPTVDELDLYIAHYGLNFTSQGDDLVHRGRTYLITRQSNHWYLTKTYPPSNNLTALILRDLRNE